MYHEISHQITKSIFTLMKESILLGLYAQGCLRKLSLTSKKLDTNRLLDLGWLAPNKTACNQTEWISYNPSPTHTVSTPMINLEWFILFMIGVGRGVVLLPIPAEPRTTRGLHKPYTISLELTAHPVRQKTMPFTGSHKPRTLKPFEITWLAHC